MKVVINVEANGLKPDKIWVIVCKDLSTGEIQVFRKVTEDVAERNRFLEYSASVQQWIGHNLLGYDWPVCVQLLGSPSAEARIEQFVDTLVISRMVDYPRSGHGAEDYGVEFGLGCQRQVDYHKYSQELEDYCIRKVDICGRIYDKYKRYITAPSHQRSIQLEHRFQCIIQDMEDYGFMVDIKKIDKLLTNVLSTLKELDDQIQEEFQPRLKLIREVTPKATKYGTISLSSIPVKLRDSICDFSVDASFSHCEWVSFNAGSPKQVVELLNKAGWKPDVKTKGHVATEREYNKLRRLRNSGPEVALKLKELKIKLENLEIYGWQINEDNLATLPKTAPASARLLSQRILYESRRKTLTEWSELVDDNSRIHGRFQSIGAWTHRMSHQKPNMANVTNEFDISGVKQLLGKELRQCWTAPKDRLLVGVDAEGIQLRIFAHYIEDKDFIKALVEGKKSDKSDPHSLNQQILGSCCKSRSAAKRFIFAFLLGAGIGKLAEILGSGQSEAEEALSRLYKRYSGLQTLKDTIIPADARRGYFVGLDGRKVRILGDTEGARRHRAMSGYLQCGEAVVIKEAATIFNPRLRDYDAHIVDIIHDEYQIETPNDFSIALAVAKIVADAITEAGVSLGLKCPLAGSYYNDDHKEYTIGRNWWETH